MMTPMRVGFLLASMVSISMAACGDDGGGADAGGSSTTGTPGTTGGPSSTGPESTGSSGGSGSGSATTDEGTVTAADTTATSVDGTATAGETTAVTTDGSSTGSTTGDASTDGSTTEVGMGSLDASMSSLQIFQDCMPIVPFDPVGASFTLELTNSGDGPASATVTSATFFDAGGMQAATIDVMPAAFGPIDGGDSSTFAVNKVANSMMPANGCETLQCNQSYTLELVLDVDGVEVTASDTAQVGCVF